MKQDPVSETEKKLFKEFRDIPCPFCKASGFVPIKAHHDEIYECLLFDESCALGLTCDQIRVSKYVTDDPSHLAMNARLSVMYHLGLVTRVRHGRNYLWSLANR